MSTTGDSPGLVMVGRIRRAHGVLGVLVVELLVPGAEELLVPGRRVFAGTMRGVAVEPPLALTVQMAEPFQGGIRVQFDRITDRDSADTWRGRYLLAPAEEVPEPDEDLLDPEDLVGLQVERANGEAVGTVEAYYELRHDLLIEVSRAEGSVLIPFRPEFVESVDVEAGRIVIEPPEGLL